MARKKIVAGNWKSDRTPSQAVNRVAELKDVSPGKLTDFSGSRSNVQSGVSNLYDVDTKFYDQKINAEKERPKYEEAKKKIEKYGASSKDKKF